MRAFWTSSFFAKSEKGGLAAVYDYHATLTTRHNEDALRLRFLAVFFVDLLSLVQPENPHRASEAVYHRFAKTIASKSATSHTSDQILQTVQCLVHKGRRLDKLTEVFGDGILIELPVDIPERTLRRMPLTDQQAFRSFVSQIDELDLRGRAKAKGSDVLATKLRKEALAPFRVPGFLGPSQRRPGAYDRVSSRHR